MSDFRFDKGERADPEVAIRREMRRTLPNGKSVSTTASGNSGQLGAKFGLLSASQILMGAGAAGDPATVLQYQDKLMSTLLGGAISEKNGHYKAGEIGGIAEVLLPDDIRIEALNQSVLSDDSGSSDVDDSFGTGTSTGGSGVPVTTTNGVIKTDATMLKRMPNFEIAFPQDSADRDNLEAGLVKPELIKCLAIIMQQIIPVGHTIYTKKRIKGSSRYSNHSYYAAIDIFGFAYQSDPTTVYSVTNSNSDTIIRQLYAILNSIIGPDRPEEVGGPERIPANDGQSGPFYQNGDHFNHIHIGYDYRSSATDTEDTGDPGDGTGGVRFDGYSSNDNTPFSGLPTVTLSPAGTIN